MKWFRFYSSVVDDPKVQRLDAFHFRFWVNLLCVSSEQDGTVPSVSDLAFRLRLSESETETVLSMLVSIDLIDKDRSGKMRPHNWDNRQYKNDRSTERVRAFRKRSMKPFHAVTETSSEQNRTDTEQSRGETPVSSAFDLSDLARRIHAAHPSRRGTAEEVERAIALQVADAVDPAARAAVAERNHAGWCASTEWEKENHRFVPLLPRWIREGRIWEEPPKPKSDGYVSVFDLPGRNGK